MVTYHIHIYDILKRIKLQKEKQTSGWQRLVWGRPLTTNGNKEIFGRMMGVFYILTVMAVRLLYVHQNS